MAESVLRDKTKVFAKDIVLLCRELKVNKVESHIINQLLRCGTSIGANVHEANYAQSKNDFVSKFEIALKEAHEAEFWLDLLSDVESIDQNVYKTVLRDCGIIRRMLIASLKTIKSK